MIRFVSIEVEEFKKFTGPTTLNLETLQPGVHFVQGVNNAKPRLGANGVGKTTLMSDAVTWCLYGRTASGLRTTDVKRWGSKKPPRVTMVLRIGDRRTNVTRGPRATDLTIDGTSVAQSDVDALIGLGYAAFCQAVIWAQEQPLFFDRTSSDKMALLSDTLGLDRWEVWSDKAARRARDLDTRVTRLQGEIAGLEQVQAAAAIAEADARTAQQRWSAVHAADVATRVATAEEARNAAHDADRRGKRADLAAEKAGVAANLLQPDVDAAKTELAKVERELADLQNEMVRGKAELRHADAHLETLEMSGTCPTCGQTVEDVEEHIQKGRALRQELIDGLAIAHDLIEDLLGACAGHTMTVDDLDEQLAQLRRVERDADHAARRHERESAAAQARVMDAERELQRAEAEGNPHREALQRARRELARAKKLTQKKQITLQKLERSADRARFWARGFRDIRLEIVESVLDDLRVTTDRALADLGLDDWTVDYVTERETKSGTTSRKLHIVVQAPDADEGVRWEVYSGGEKQRLRLAGALALSDVLLAHAGTSIDFRVLDEVTRGLTPEGVRDLTTTLHEYAQVADLRLLFIDHRAEEGVVFSSQITVVRDDDGARIDL